MNTDVTPTPDNKVQPRRPVTLVISLLAALLLAGGAYFFVMNSQSSVCADQIRSVRDEISASIKVAQENLSAIEASSSVGGGKTYTDELQALSASDLLVLKGCDAQCRLLETCLSRNRSQGPAEACPREYGDYQDRYNEALSFFAKLQLVQEKTSEAGAIAAEAVKTDAALQTAIKQSGATGGTVAVLKSKLDALRRELDRASAGIEAPLAEASAQARRTSGHAA